MFEQTTALSLISPEPEHLIAFVQEADPRDLKPDTITLTRMDGHHNDVYAVEVPPCSDPRALPRKSVLRHPRATTGIGPMEAECRVREDILHGLRTPRVLHFGYLPLPGVQSPAMLEEYIDGEPKPFDTLTGTEIISLADAIKEVHERTSGYFSSTSGQEPTCTGTYGDYMGAMVAESVTGPLETFDMRPYSQAEQMVVRGLRKLECLVAATPEFSIPAAFSLLHRDLSWRNVLWPDGAMLIDWNATYGDIPDDLSYVLVDNQVPPAFEEAFLAAYAPTPEVLARMEAYTYKNRLDDMMWAIGMQVRYGAAYDAVYTQRFEALQALLEGSDR